MHPEYIKLAGVDDVRTFSSADDTKKMRAKAVRFGRRLMKATNDPDAEHIVRKIKILQQLHEQEPRRSAA